MIHFPFSAGKFFGGKMGLLRAVLASLFLWFLFSLVFPGIVEGILFFLFSLSGICLFSFYAAGRARRRHAERVNGSIPFFLLGLRVKLLLGKSMEECLRELGVKGKGAFYSELGKTVREFECLGASVEDALLHLAERVDSIPLKRAVSCIVQLSEQGFSAGELNSLGILARELLAEEKAKIREFSGKIVVFSLMFVAVSAVFPALFLAFVAVGSLFLEIGLSPLQAVVVPVVLFPLIDLGAMLFIREKIPLIEAGGA